MKKNNVKILFAFIGGIIIFFLSLFIFTQPAIWKSWDFSNTGQIGDTIGGITAPIISMIGTILIYYSFREQYIANNLQRSALMTEVANARQSQDFNTLYSMFNDIVHEVDNFKFLLFRHGRMTGPGIAQDNSIITYSGLNGIAVYIDIIQKRNSLSSDEFEELSQLLNIKYILGSLRNLYEKADASATIHQDDKNLIKDKVSFYYQAKLQTLIEKIVTLDIRDSKDIMEYIRKTNEFLNSK